MIENKSYLNNSLSYNPINDDPTLKNYLALYYTIVGKKDKDGKIHKVESGTACRAFNIYGYREHKNKQGHRNRAGIYTNKEILAKNLVTGEVKKYNGSRELSEDLGITVSAVGTYIKKKVVFKGTYIFTTNEN